MSAAVCTRLAALVAAAALAGTAPTSAHDARGQRAFCSVTDVRSDQAPRRHYRFRATRVVDLELEALVLGRSGRERRLELRVYTPDGFLYQSFETALEAGSRKHRRFEARLPVAGTSIMMSGLYGRWTVVPHLDGQRERCGPARSFVIQP
jgi:hypothetical protein